MGGGIIIISYTEFTTIAGSAMIKNESARSHDLKL